MTARPASAWAEACDPVDRVPPARSSRSTAIVTAMIAVVLSASAMPTPLYSSYQRDWHISTALVTTVFAMYALGVLASLMTVGALSDVVGRRRMMLAALAGLLATAVLFLLATSVAWLIAARVVQGFSTGIALAAGSAALLDLQPAAPASAALRSSVAVEFGLASGALVATVIVACVPAPRAAVFGLLLVVAAASMLAVRTLPETAPAVQSVGRRRRRPGVPHAIRRRFVLAAFGVLASWSLPGLYLALGPDIATTMLRTDGDVPGGIAVALLSVAAGLAQLLLHRVAARARAGWGAIVLAIGVGLTLGALSARSDACFLAASAVVGAGFGLTFSGTLGLLAQVTPETRRAETMSAFYVVAYGSFSVPTLIAGAAAERFGLAATFQCFAAVVVVIACGVGAIVLRTS